MVDGTQGIDPLTAIAVAAGSPTPEESAAAIAVVAGMLKDGGSADDSDRPDRWADSVDWKSTSNL